mgnify:CR=1 FL=1
MTTAAAGSVTRVVPDVSPVPFVPDDFEVPRSLRAEHFVLEPLGPQHNVSDHAAWGSSIDHIRSTPGFDPDDWGGDTWPYPMSAEQNLADLQMHAGEFERREAFAYTVLDGDGDGAEVIGCVYIDPDNATDALLRADAMVRCWVRSDRALLDPVLAASVREWLAASWPFTRVRFPGRDVAVG